MLWWERRCENRREYIQFPLLFLSESLPRRFQCDASSVGSENCRLSTGSPSLWLGYHPRLSMVRLRRRRELLCVAVGAEVGEQERVYTVSTFILVRASPSTLSVRLLCRTATERLMFISGKAYRLVIDKLSLLFVAFLAPFMLLRC